MVMIDFTTFRAIFIPLFSIALFCAVFYPLCPMSYVLWLNTRTDFLYQMDFTKEIQPKNSDLFFKVLFFFLFRSTQRTRKLALIENAVCLAGCAKLRRKKSWTFFSSLHSHKQHHFMKISVGSRSYQIIIQIMYLLKS